MTDTIKIKQEYQRKSYHIKLSVYRFREGEAYIYYCPSLDLSAYGYTENEGLEAFDTSVRMYFEDVISRGLLVKDLQRLGWDIKSVKQNKTKAPSEEALRQHRPEFAKLLSQAHDKIERSLSVAA